MIIVLSALPALGIGLACITRRWMPEQFANSGNGKPLQHVLGIGSLAIATSLIAFAILYPFVPKASLPMVTVAFVITVNIEAFGMVFLLLRLLNKKT